MRSSPVLGSYVLFQRLAVLSRQVVGMEKALLAQLIVDKESITSERQTLAGVRSRLSIEHEHGARPTPQFVLAALGFGGFERRKDSNRNR